MHAFYVYDLQPHHLEVHAESPLMYVMAWKLLSCFLKLPVAS